MTASLLVLCCMLAWLPAGAAAAGQAAGPDNAVAVQAGDSYHLSKYDVVDITIPGFTGVPGNSGDSEKSGTSGLAGFSNVMIGPDGYVNLPYVGIVKLGGLTIPEANAMLLQRLGEYVKAPSLAIMVTKYGPRKVYVMGAVRQQGLYEMGTEYMNVFAAISSAGGITTNGRPKHIAIVHVQDGKMHMQEVNFDRFIKKQDPSQNPPLQDGDMVYVPTSNKIDLFSDVMPLVNSFAVFRAIIQ